MNISGDEGKKFPQVEEDAMISSEEEMSPEENFEAERPHDSFCEDEDQNGIENGNGSSLKFHSREGSLDKDSDESPELEKESLSAALQNLMVDFHWPEGTSITIERVESTKVAVAELTAAAIQSSTSEYSSASLQDLALIQSTLFTLQQQQLVQLQLIQQLLTQLAMCNGELDSGQDSEPSSPLPLDMENGHEHRKPRDDKDKSTVTKSDKRTSASPEEPSNNRISSNAPSSTGETLSMKFASMLNCGNQDPNRPLSPGLASSYSLNSIMMPDGGSSEEPNTLEMLQKRAQEVLDSASQGLLASSLVDESYRKTGILDKREPFFKHRCKYCGKVFGSDSALQIHIRSHTGERPFKCNVCGSRFTTKGNLKVHFQRHSMKFPHVKMNPHPVPEHLDHFHPPILSNGERSPELLPSSLPFGPLPPFQPMNFMRFDDHAAKLRMQLQEALEPEDLSKAKIKIPMGKSSVSSLPPRRSHSRSDNEEEDDDAVMESKNETLKSREEGKSSRVKIQEKEFEENGKDEDGEMEDLENDAQEMDIDTDDSFNGTDQPENLSSKSLPLMHSLPLQASRPGRPSSASKNSKSHRRHSQSPAKEEPTNFSSGTIDDLNLMELAKDPRAYAALLPRPGSASSAWESLIEVNTSSETSKLQQLVDNIDNQISDPNECVVCHRVLSCKSALQMHYRTHTGERPFKCRLCGRAFTTKGNLKTHMGVHRIKEGDTHHQCPVCHKRFTTQLVLQQHIRLHTGEPTDLTLDQIRAGEIRDFVPSFSQAAAANAAAISFLQQQQQQHHQQQQQQQQQQHQPPPQLKSDSSRDATTPGTPEVKFSTSLAALENQVRTVTTFAGSQGIFPEDLSKKVGAGPATPSAVPLAAASSVSRTSGHSPATTDSELSSSDWARQSESDYGTTPPSQAASTPFLPLDLTPKNNMFSPFMPNLNPLMGNSALTSLANSVLNSTAAFNPVHMSVIAGRGEFESGAARGNTTCSICLKTFACNSALEIHYRSHTKERPFKCTVCERGFSTKGNMKQHMLTHKIRDMPPTVFDGSKLHNHNSNSGDTLSNMSQTKPPAPSSAGSKGSSNELPSPETPRKDEVDSPPKPKDIEVESKEPEMKPRHRRPESMSEHRHHDESRPAGRIAFGHSNDDDSRNSFSSGGSKHMCPVCQKSFSSSSSLHIHMRTHTGDKPFKCSVCQKAFTTKGNLKVHMGTHMWTSGASRRGRRMSLELPLGLQFQPPTGDRVDGRFFPFVPPNFPGGPVNLAATKFGDYPIFRPPVPFPMMMANNSMNSDRPPAKEEEEEVAEAKEEDEESSTP
ncbi:unnamed protein product [Allacma fusca]|uniref:Homeotic protein spalt-major n=1 Tax=Allacma fusca TaxID=39272 RepID=A0A8J2K2Y9_9HEXA|nr:unnamed protein product [Allacma fusca]